MYVCMYACITTVQAIDRDQTLINEVASRSRSRSIYLDDQNKRRRRLQPCARLLSFLCLALIRGQGDRLTYVGLACLK